MSSPRLAPAWSAAWSPAWSPERIAQLRALWDEGVSTTDIARRLGTTKNAVVGKAHRLRLPGRPSPILPAGAPRPARAKPVPKGAPTLPAFMRPATPPAPPPLPPPPAPRPAPRACCWPEGDPGTPGFHFCGVPAAPGRFYCATHAAVAFVPIRPRDAAQGY